MESILGTRIRERRRQIGLSQAEMARQMDISASYLNLIERNKRRIAGGLLGKAASVLGLTLDELDGANERRLMEHLAVAAEGPAFSAAGVETHALGELIGRYPGWARGIAALARSEETAQQTVRVLSDQLAHDPFLREGVHNMLTKISSIRSASEILTDFADMATMDRKRFDQIVRDEARALTEVGETLAAYFEKSLGTERVLTPTDEVDAMFLSAKNRFAWIDTAAEELSSRIDPGGPEARWASAQAVAAAMLQPEIEAEIDQRPEVETDAGRARANRALQAYAAAAILLPAGRFARRAETLAYDIERLAQTFDAPIEAVCQRLTSLDHGAAPRFGYVQANASGSILEHRAVEGLALPRYNSGCPIWLLFRAQSNPHVLLQQGVTFPSGHDFVFIARARQLGERHFGAQKHYVTDLLAIPASDAQRTVYDLPSHAILEEVGPGCRLCPRTDCGHRVEDPLLG